MDDEKVVLEIPASVLDDPEAREVLKHFASRYAVHSPDNPEAVWFPQWLEPLVRRLVDKCQPT